MEPNYITVQLHTQLKETNRSNGSIDIEDLNTTSNGIRKFIAQQKGVKVQKVVVEKMFYYPSRKPPKELASVVDVSAAASMKQVRLGVRFSK